MPVISDIAIRIRAITDPFTRGLARARSAVRGFAGRMTMFFSPVTSMFGNLGRSIMGLLNPLNLLKGVFLNLGLIMTAVAGGGLAMLIKKQFELIDVSAKTAKALGLSVDFLEGMKLAGSQMGITNEKMIKSFKKLTRTIGEAKLATGAGATLFRIWGKDVKDFQGLSIEDSFRKVAKDLAKIKDPAKQAALAVQLFGRDGIEMLNLINAGGDAIDNFVDESKRLKGSFSEVDTARVEAANDAFDKMKISIGGIFKQLTFVLSPFVKFFADKLTNVFVNLRQRLEQSKKSIINGIVRGLKMAGEVVFAVAKVFKILAVGIESFFGLDGPKAIEQFQTAIIRTIGTVAFFAEKMSAAKGSITGDFKDTANIIGIAFKSMWENMMHNGEAFFDRVVRGLIGLAGLAKDINMIFVKLWKEGLKGNAIDLTKEIDDALAKAKADRKKNRKEAMDFEGLSETMEKNLEEFAKKTKDKFGGAVGEGFKQGLMGNKAELNKFLDEFIADIGKRGTDFESALKGMFDELMEGMPDGSDFFEDMEKGAAGVTLTPKLALKGSQEAAKIAAGAMATDAKIQENTKRTAINTKRMLDLINELKMPAGNINTINPFGPAEIGGAIV